jgi:hypothetical protein
MTVLWSSLESTEPTLCRFSFILPDFTVETKIIELNFFRVLQVILDPFVTSVGIQALSKLKNLQQFLFADLCRESFKLQLQCLLLCAQFLPRLRIVGSEFKYLSSESMLECAQAGKFYHNQVLQLPSQLCLEKLILSGEVKLHDACQLPELRELHLFSPSSSVVGYFRERFSAISHIGFYKSAVETAMEVLQLVGGRIRSLVIEEPLLELSMVTILQLCPKLNKLKLYKCMLSDFNITWKDQLFSCLEDVTLECMLDEPFPHGFIKMVKS